MTEARVILKISIKGIESAEICADNADQQTAGHVLLAAVSSELQCLDAALKTLGARPKQKAYCIAINGRFLSGQDRVTRGPILHINQKEAALVLTKDAGEELSLLLRQAGFKPRLVENKHADQDNIIDNVSDVWSVETTAQ